jgi:4-azaleucine resistance transporter AzlC
VPFAIIFGAVAVTSGLSPGAAVAMSAFVFAGSAQFVAAGMISAGAGGWIIIATTFIVNLRHSLYAATLAPYVRHLPERWLIPLGFSLTDEAFVVVIRRYQAPDPAPFKHWYHLGAAGFLYVAWQLGTYAGLWAGQAIPNPRAWGLDFAFPVAFLGMLIPMIRGAAMLACVAAAGAGALLLRTLPHQLGLLAAALLGVAAGLLLEYVQSKTPNRAISQDEPGAPR